ncbi:MAG: GTPase [Thermoplasmata archaeon]|nr:MAG: GTPase [Thermoplasmata archaeon]
MGAAGRDFHNYNVFFRDVEEYQVVAFTATQIPNIEGRTYPPVLAGDLYPEGIPIIPEEDLEDLIAQEDVDIVVFSYSDISHETVMHLASRTMAAGASFMLLGHDKTAIRSSKPVVAVCAARTGSGKSQTTRAVASILKDLGMRIAVIRHPMPYGDLAKQAVQRFETYADLDLHDTTIEEREEYEPHIDAGNLVFAGVDYEAILREAEESADVILWDGGNNDSSFYKTDLYITILDALRPGHSTSYHPGEVNLRLADVLIINKIDSADPEDITSVEQIAAEYNPIAEVILARSPVRLDDPEAVLGKRVLVIEDGPTLTHGGMTFGAGYVAAKTAGAESIVDPRPYATGSIKGVFHKYAHLKDVLPAMGYGDEQVKELEDTINAVPCDVVVAGTPIDITRIIQVNKPMVRARYDLGEVGAGRLKAHIERILS